TPASTRRHVRLHAERLSFHAPPYVPRAAASTARSGAIGALPGGILPPIRSRSTCARRAATSPARAPAFSRALRRCPPATNTGASKRAPPFGAIARRETTPESPPTG